MGLCTRLPVFIVINPTICLVKLYFIFFSFSFTAIEFGVGCEHNAQLDSEAKG